MHGGKETHCRRKAQSQDRFDSSVIRATQVPECQQGPETIFRSFGVCVCVCMCVFLFKIKAKAGSSLRNGCAMLMRSLCLIITPPIVLLALLKLLSGSLEG